VNCALRLPLSATATVGSSPGYLRPALGLRGWREYVGAFVRRSAVGVDDEVVVALIDGLQWRASGDVEDPAGGDDVALRRLAEVHREASCEDDEGLLLL